MAEFPSARCVDVTKPPYNADLPARRTPSRRHAGDREGRGQRGRLSSRGTYRLNAGPEGRADHRPRRGPRQDDPPAPGGRNLGGHGRRRLVVSQPAEGRRRGRRGQGSDVPGRRRHERPRGRPALPGLAQERSQAAGHRPGQLRIHAEPDHAHRRQEGERHPDFPRAPVRSSDVPCAADPADRADRRVRRDRRPGDRRRGRERPGRRRPHHGLRLLDPQRRRAEHHQLPRVDLRFAPVRDPPQHDRDAEGRDPTARGSWSGRPAPRCSRTTS